MKKKVFVIISAPSGAGKKTVIGEMKILETRIHVCVSWTTRDPRPDETYGVDYTFASTVDFLQKQGEGGFLESELIGMAYYGTPNDQLFREDDHLSILEVDMKGHLNLRRILEEQDHLVISVLLVPPDKVELRRRLWNRNDGASEEERRRRFDRGCTELDRIPEFEALGAYIVLNEKDKASEAAAKILEILSPHFVPVSVTA